MLLSISPILNIYLGYKKWNTSIGKFFVPWLINCNKECLFPVPCSSLTGRWIFSVVLFPVREKDKWKIRSGFLHSNGKWHGNQVFVMVYNVHRARKMSQWLWIQISFHLDGILGTQGFWKVVFSGIIRLPPDTILALGTRKHQWFIPNAYGLQLFRTHYCSMKLLFYKKLHQ